MFRPILGLAIALWPLRCPAEEHGGHSRDFRSSKIPRDFQVGAAVAQRMEEHFGLSKDPALRKRVSDIGYRVAAASGQDIPFVFNVLDMGDPNAVALPGGFIYVTKGLLELDLTDDELANVLAHECGHVIREHHKRIQKSAGLINLIHAAVVTGAILASQSGSSHRSTDSLGREPGTGVPNSRSEQIAAAAVMSGVASNLFLLRFVREFEMEADRTGRSLSTGAGFSSDGSESMLKKLQSRSYERPGMGILRTHPYLEDRIQVAQGQAKELTASPNPREALPCQNRIQEMLHYWAMEYWAFQHKETARFLLRNAYDASRQGPLADDSKVQGLLWLEEEQKEQSHLNRDYGFFCHQYEEVLKEFPATNLKELMEGRLEEYRKRRDSLYPAHLERLNSERIIPSFGEYFLRNYPDDSRREEASYKLAEAYRQGRKHKEAAEMLLKLLKESKDASWSSKAHESFQAVLPRLTSVKLAYQYFELLTDDARKTAVSDGIRSLVSKSEDIEDLGQLREDHPKSAFEAALVERLKVLAKETLAKARFFRKTRNYSDSAFEYYKVSRYSPDPELAKLANQEIKEMQELDQ